MRTLIKKLLDLLSPRDRLVLLGMMGLLVIIALIEMVGIAAVMPFMAVATNPETIHTNKWLQAAYTRLGFQSDGAFLLLVGYLLLGLLVLGNISKAIGAWVILRYENRLARDLSRRLLAGYMARPYKFFLDSNTAELGSTILVMASRVTSGVIAPILGIVSTSFVCIAILTLLVIVDPLVAVVIAVVLCGLYAAIYMAVRRVLARIGRQQVEASNGKFLAASEALAGIKDLKVLGRESAYLTRFTRYANIHASSNVVAGVITQLPRYAFEIISVGGILLVVLHLIGQGGSTSQLIPLLALYAFAGYRLMPTLQTLFAAVTNLRVNISSLNVVHSDLITTAPVRDPEALLESGRVAQPLTFERSLELKGVSFRYDGARENSVKNLNLLIRAYSSIGLVGPTGCGKTTTADLILGLLTPQEGKILVDGVDINAGNPASWRKILGYVPQQIYISDDTMARNIAFGVPDDELDMDAVRRAAAIANLDKFIEGELPDGYHTEIGERGVRLSGGQRQRIGIARALYRDPKILVMDEATSALDGVTEEGVMDAVHRLSGKKTVILIAHRLTTVKDCDQIFQLDRGEVAASGTYDQLMQQSSWFRAAATGSVAPS